jgi:hypothetical protein
MWSCVSLGGIVTAWTDEFVSRQGREIVPDAQCPHRGPASPSSVGNEVERLGREADHSPTFGTEIMVAAAANFLTASVV